MRTILLSIFVLVAQFVGQAQSVDGTRPSSPGGTIFQVGEELEYGVSYAFFNIGTIRLKITGVEKRGTRTIYTSTTWMDSNPAISWIADVHIRFYSTIDQEGFTYRWIGDDSSKTAVETRKMEFDYEAKKMTFESGKRTPDGRSQVYGRETVLVRDRSQDGLSLFYYARKNALELKSERVPTFVDNREAVTQINFTGKSEPVDIDVVDYPINTIYIDGKAGFVGVFGLTGGFEGWFSKDEARIPVLARMKVIVGSVKVQLKRWVRPGWVPPRRNAS